MPAIPILHPDARNARAGTLEGAGFNGLRMAIVEALDTVSNAAAVDLFFFNQEHLADFVTSAIFSIQGGLRVRAGAAVGQVRVTGVQPGSSSDSLRLTIAPIGDYSTYTLRASHDKIDPFFSELPFKFRPGCFTNNCAPDWDGGAAALPSPAIDYLAKDYESFRHQLIAAMMQRVPGWQTASEADLDQVLIDLFAAAGDELSDFQDRVMNEAYLGTCRGRVSLARHARLMDYHIHQGNQSSTWLALRVNTEFELPLGMRFTPAFELEPMFQVWSGTEHPLPESAMFAARDEAHFHPRLNDLRLYTWDDSVAALSAGSTGADLLPDVHAPTQADAQTVADLLSGSVRQLLIQEWLNPSTGQTPGRNTAKRQLLRIADDTDAVKLVHDTLRDQWMVRVKWRREDALRQSYCFRSICSGATIRDISLFHGNLTRVYHGSPLVTTFVEPGVVREADTSIHRYRTFERTARWGTLCRLPDQPLAYLPSAPGGEIEPASTLLVEVEEKGQWEETISLVHSFDGEQGQDFAVETDELGRSTIRFGNGVNGCAIPDGAKIHCAYQVGGGSAGNAGFDSLIYQDHQDHPLVDSCWNPFDVTDGREPEPREKILRNAPEAYRARQLRAVTLDDYRRRAEEVPGVSRAAARYAWTGSWRTVRLSIDPEESTEISDDLRQRLVSHLEAVRLIGEDIELRPPRFVPLEIHATVCVSPDCWPEDVRWVLEQEFSTGYTPDGRRGFFHPDNWTFGQALHRSEIEGRIHAVRGVCHIASLTMKRFRAPGEPDPNWNVLEVGADEIVLAENDPDHLERGFIRFFCGGGRQ